MASIHMQFSGSNHTCQIAFRVLLYMELYQTIFPLVVESHKGLYLDPCYFSFNYINDLQECELSSSALVYADDTSLTLSAYDPQLLKKS